MAQFITVLLMCILAGAEVDLFIPSFPELQRIFNLSPFMVEATLAVNLIGHCFSSIIVGNLGDKYGRKPIIITGLIIFITGSLFCVFASCYIHLIIGRMLQGIGIAGPGVLAYLVIADNYSASKQQKMLGILNGVITLAMAFAPVVGSYVNLFYSWRGNFTVLLILSIIALAASLIFIKHTLRSNIKVSLKEYLPVIKSSKVLTFIFTQCLFDSAYWLFVAMGPILYMEDLGVTLREFGLYQGAIAFAFAVVSLSSGWCFKKFGRKKCFKASMVVLLIFFFINLILIIINSKSAIHISLAMVLMSAGITFPINLLYPVMLESIENAKGRIAATSVAIRLTVTAISLQIVSYIYDETYFYIGIAVAIGVAGGFFGCYRLVKRQYLTFED